MFVSRFESILSVAVFSAAVLACKDAPSGWSLLGCHVDSGSTHLLPTTISYSNQPDVTWEKCATACASTGNSFFGLGAGYTCCTFQS